MTAADGIRFLTETPAEYGRLIGFDRLTKLHNDWIRDMVLGMDDRTLLAHRGSYKTTCVSIALAVLMILRPECRIMFIRKTDADIMEIIRQTKKILQNPATRYIVRGIYDVDLRLVRDTAASLHTNLSRDTRGTMQLSGMGCGGSITGKHFERIFTDDIVNINDRLSKAERDRTKLIYMELQNVKNKGGRIFNTGTPWHPDDAFSIMPEPEKFDCYSTGILTDNDIQYRRAHMSPSLFAANYELRHIADEDMIFTNPHEGEDIASIVGGIGHIDAAYGGADYTAFTAAKRVGDLYFVYGRLWNKAVDIVENEILSMQQQYQLTRLYCEKNADKGYLAKELMQRGGKHVISYHETTNKYMKITTYLKGSWENVRFVVGTDREYINQICDFNENAEHDDAPDSLASLIRLLWHNKSTYVSALGLDQ